jgi:hypothetical protein
LFAFTITLEYLEQLNWNFSFGFISNEFISGGSIATIIQNTNIQVTYTIHISHKISPLETKTNKIEKNRSAHSYTNREGHVAANEYRVEKEKEIKFP